MAASSSSAIKLPDWMVLQPTKHQGFGTFTNRSWKARDRMHQGEVPLASCADDTATLHRPTWDITLQLLAKHREAVLELLPLIGHQPEKDMEWEEGDSLSVLVIRTKLGVDKVSEQLVRDTFWMVAHANLDALADKGEITCHHFLLSYSWLNHSCDPNAQLCFTDSRKGELTLVARRDIESGEEITITYVPFFLKSQGLRAQDRRTFLQHSLWFCCTCVKCEAETAAPQ